MERSYGIVVAIIGTMTEIHVLTERVNKDNHPTGEVIRNPIRVDSVSVDGQTIVDK